MRVGSNPRGGGGMEGDGAGDQMVFRTMRNEHVDCSDGDFGCGR